MLALVTPGGSSAPTAPPPVRWMSSHSCGAQGPAIVDDCPHRRPIRARHHEEDGLFCLKMARWSFLFEDGPIAHPGNRRRGPTMVFLMMIIVAIVTMVMMLMLMMVVMEMIMLI